MAKNEVLKNDKNSEFELVNLCGDVLAHDLIHLHVSSYDK